MWLIVGALAVLVVALGALYGGELDESKALKKQLRSCQATLHDERVHFGGMIHGWDGEREALEASVHHYRTLAANRAARITNLEQRLSVLPSRGPNGKFAPRVQA